MTTHQQNLTSTPSGGGNGGGGGLVGADNNTNTNSNSNVIDTKKILRHVALVEPSADNPWSVDVTSAIPRDIMTQMNNAVGSGQKYVTGCTVGRWSCAVLLVQPTSSTSKLISSTTTMPSSSQQYQYQLYIWYVYPHQSLNQQKFKSPYLVLDHDNVLNNNSPKKTSSSSSSSSSSTKKGADRIAAPPLVAMTIAENPYSTGSSTSTSSTTGDGAGIDNSGTSNSNRTMALLNSNYDGSVYVYALNPYTGVVVMWKVSRSDLQPPTSSQQQQQQQHSELGTDNNAVLFHSHQRRRLPFGCKCNVLRSPDDVSTSDNNSKVVRLTSLHVSWARPSSTTGSNSSSSSSSSATRLKGSPCIVVASSNGYLYWITQTHVPMSLHIQEISVAEQQQARDDNYYYSYIPGSSLLTRLFTPSKKKVRVQENDNGNNSSNHNHHNIVAVQILDHSNNITGNTDDRSGAYYYYFLSTSITGQIILWKVQLTESSHHSIIEIGDIVSEQGLSCDTITDYYQKRNNALLLSSSTMVSPPLSSTVTIHNAVVKVLPVANTTTTTASYAGKIWISLLVTTENQHVEPHDSRMYWIQMTTNAIPSGSSRSNKAEVVHIAWLNRFVDPVNTVRIIGLTISDNYIAYAAFSPKNNDDDSNDETINSNDNIVMALAIPASNPTNDETQNQQRELSMPRIQHSELNTQQLFLPNMWSPDIVTHGVSALDRTGLGLRVRFMPEIYNKNDSKQKVSFMATTDSDGIRRHGVNRTQQQSKIQKLIHYFHASHEESYVLPDQIVRLPPAITSAVGTIEIEEAIIEYCQKAMTTNVSSSSSMGYLQNTRITESDEGGYQAQSGQEQQNNINESSSNNSNALEWHLSFIYLLHQTGIYRTLSKICKWKLLEIGQQASVYDALYSYINNDDELDISSMAWQRRQLRELHCHDVGEWLSEIQGDTILRFGAGDFRQAVWLKWLCIALETAMTLREENAMSYYDVTPNQTPLVESPGDLPIWTSKSMMQSILSKQLNFWLKSRHGRSTATIEQIEMVVQYALQSYCDSFFSCPDSPDARKKYAKCLQVSVKLIRQVKDLADDHFAFALSQAHNYFDGLCQIAMDHERRSDSDVFSLIPLFSQLENVKDVGSNQLFGKHVLQWHAQHKYYGQVLNYGRECPDVLDEMMQTVEALEPYRWIYAARTGDFYSARESLIEKAEKPDSTVADSKTAISIASLCNAVLEKQPKKDDSTVVAIVQRRSEIDKKQELINAQEELFGEKLSQTSTTMSATELLDHALKRFRNCQDLEERIQICVISLAICSAFETIEKTKEGAVFVWYEVISADKDQWEEWLQSVTDITNEQLREHISESTVFGGLIQQCKDTNEWVDVTYNSYVQRTIFGTLSHRQPTLFTNKMKRLLRSVSAAATVQNMEE